MSLNRQDIEDRLMDYLYEELTDEESAAFEEELRHHPDLQAEVSAHRRTRSAFARLPEVEVPHLVQANILREARKAAAAVDEAQRRPKGLLARIAELLMQPAAATAMVAVLVAAIGLYVADRRMLAGDADRDAREDLYGPERPTISAAEPAARDQAAAAREQAEGAAAGGPVGGAETEEEAEVAVAPVPTPAATEEKPDLPGGADPADDLRVAETGENQARGKGNLALAETRAAQAAPLADADAAPTSKGLYKSKDKKLASKLGLRRDDKEFAAARPAPRPVDSNGGAAAGGQLGDLTVLDAETPQELRPAPPATATGSSVALGREADDRAPADAPQPFPDMAGNIEQRAGGWAGGGNAVRDGYLQRSTGATDVAKAPAAEPQAPAKATTSSAAEKVFTQKAEKKAEAKPVEPAAAPEPTIAAGSMGRYEPSQQQMKQRKAAEVVYGGEGTVDSARTTSSLGGDGKLDGALGGLLGRNDSKDQGSGLRLSEGEAQAFEAAQAPAAPTSAPPVVQAQTVTTEAAGAAIPVEESAPAQLADVDALAEEAGEAGLESDDLRNASGVPKDGGRDLIAKGDALLAAGNVQGAIAAYEQAAKLDAGLAALSRHKVALAYRKANRFLDALVSYDGLLKNYPRYQNRGSALREKFEVSMALGRLDNAERTLKELEQVESAAAVEELRSRLFARRVALEAERGGNGKAAGAAKGHAAPARAKAAMDAYEAPAENSKPSSIETVK